MTSLTLIADPVCATAVAPVQPAPVARILHGFDDLRRVVAREVAGTPGVFLGFDAIEIDREAIAALCGDELLSLSAMQIEALPGRHQVEYLASATPVVVDGIGRSQTIVRGHGWTITPLLRTTIDG